MTNGEKSVKQWICYLNEKICELTGEIGDCIKSIVVGTTTTGDPGTDASVENVGTDKDLILDFTIPRGDKGDKGDPGDPGQDGATPEIGENGNWFINGVDTGKPSTGEQGEPGATPEIGVNGNWWIDGVDTGMPSRGEQGEPGPQGPPGECECKPHCCFTESNMNAWNYGTLNHSSDTDPIVMTNREFHGDGLVLLNDYYYFKEHGRYLVTYNVTSETPEMKLRLKSAIGASWIGSVSAAKSDATNPMINVSATAILDVPEGGELDDRYSFALFSDLASPIAIPDRAGSIVATRISNSSCEAVV